MFVRIAKVWEKSFLDIKANEHVDSLERSFVNDSNRYSSSAWQLYTSMGPTMPITVRLGITIVFLWALSVLLPEKSFEMLGPIYIHYVEL